MTILKRMLMMLAMVCFVASITFAQKQQDPKNNPPPKPDVKVKIDDTKGKDQPKNDNKGNDNKGKKP